MKYFFYALLSLLSLLGIVYLVVFNLNEHKGQTEAESRAVGVANESIVEFDYLLRPLLAGGAFLAQSNSLQSLVRDEKNQESILNDFSLVAQTHPVFQQVRFLDTLGMEVFRVDYRKGGVVQRSESELQNKAHRKYFSQAKKLDTGQVYVTPIGLNQEYGVIDVPYEAVLRIIYPVDDQSDGRIGYLILNVSVERLIGLLDVRSHPEHEMLVLVNAFGEGVVCTKDSISYCFSNSSKGSFAARFPLFWRVLDEKSNGLLNTDSGTYSWREFDIAKSSSAFPEVISYLEPNMANFKVLTYSPIFRGDWWLFINPLDKLLIVVLTFSFIALALSFVVGRARLEKRHRLINELNDELTKSQKNLNAEKRSLTKAVHELSYRNKQLNEFGSIISHNIRSPLSSLSLLIDYLVVHHSQLSTEGRTEAFENLQLSAGALNALAEDLWDTVEILDNKEVKLEKVSLHEVLSSVTASLAYEIKLSNVEVTLDAESWAFLIYNEDYLHTILYNLLSNAIRYRNKERGLVVALITGMVKDKKVLKVVDNGRGINLDWHSNSIFGMHRTFHGDIAGRGMGLFMVKMQVETLGGNIFLESKVDVGTTFTIMF